MLEYSNYLILGAGRSGLGMAKYLSRHQKKATLFDAKGLDALIADGFGAEEAARLEGIDCRFGENPSEADISKADIIITSPGIDPNVAPLAAARSRNKPIVSEIEFSNALYPGKLVAITGTNGKTTTTSLTAATLAASGFDAHAAGNIGDAFINYVDSSSKDTILALEISSFQLDGTEGLAPAAAVITNITPDHLDRHLTMENYVAAKAKIFAKMASDGLLILNDDDELCRGLAKSAPCTVKYFTAKPNPGADAWLDGDTIYLKGEDGPIALADMKQLQIIGAHNAANAMCAAMASLYMGGDIEKIRAGLKGFSPVEHRLEFVREVGGVKYINDSKGTNPDATEIALKAVDAPVIIFLGGYDKHSEFDSLAGLLKEKAKHAIVLGQTKGKVASMLSKAGVAFSLVEDYEEGLRLAHEIAEPGDTVLLSPACASWDMFDNYETRGKLFKDLVRAL